MILNKKDKNKAYFHLPSLFEHYAFYLKFLPLYFNHREYFYDFCDIGSIYGAPSDCIWGGGRVSYGEYNPNEVISLLNEYGISPRLTFSNSLLEKEHLSDKKCNELCDLFSEKSKSECGIIVHSELLLNYLFDKYPNFYFVCSTTKVITRFCELVSELSRSDFRFVVPDFRFNRDFDNLKSLTLSQKAKVEFLINECCHPSCTARKACYESVSRKNLGIDTAEHHCTAPYSEVGYRFSDAMQNPMFIGCDDIQNIYMPLGFSNFKIEGRGLGSAVLLEFILYYMTKPEYRLKVRENLYLDSMLDLF